MFLGGISLSSVLLLLLVDFLRGFRLELIYISLIENIRSSLTHLNGFQLLVLLPYFIEITFFHLHQKNKSSNSKVKFRQAINRCKRVLEAAKLAYAKKTKESITSKKLGFHDFWQVVNSVLNKGKSTISPPFNGPEVLLSASDKAKLFPKNFSMNSNLDDPGISLPVFPFRTNLKLHDISDKKIVTNHDLSKASGPDCILVVVLKNSKCLK